MKKLVTILLIMFSLSCWSQVPSCEGKFLGKDKIAHFTFSAAFTMLGTEIAKDYNAKNPELIGIISGFSIGLAKEFLYDEHQSSRDLLADFTGCVAGIYLNKIFNKWETKHFYNKPCRKK